MSEAHSPRVSVIVPAYNKPEYLPECLRSVQAQTFTDWECIVVNDGSPRADEIRAAVAAMNDPRFRLVEHEKNLGPGAARNEGARSSRGAYLIFLDEDDKISMNLVGALYEALRDGLFDIAHPSATTFGGRSEKMITEVPDVSRSLRGQPLLGAGYMIAKTTFYQVGEYDEHPTLALGREDFEWWIRAISTGVRVSIIPEATYFYRQPADVLDTSTSLNNAAKRHELRIRTYIVAKHRELYRTHGASRRRFLSGGWAAEAAAMKRNGEVGRSALLMWRAYLLYPDVQRLRRAVGLTVEAAVGPAVANALRRWWRSLNGEGKPGIVGR